MGTRMENTLQPSLWHGGLGSLSGSTGRGGTGVLAQGTSRGRGGGASAGGPARQGLTAWELLRLRARQTSPRSLPSAPQSRPAHLPLRSWEAATAGQFSVPPAYFVPSLLFTHYSFHTVLVASEFE